MGRPLRRRAARVGMGQVGGRRPLRRRDAMVDIDELQLSMSRLGVSDRGALENIVEGVRTVIAVLSVRVCLVWTKEIVSMLLVVLVRQEMVLCTETRMM